MFSSSVARTAPRTCINCLYGKVDHESLENQPGEVSVQIGTVAPDSSAENESEEEEKETRDIGVANKDIDKQTEIILDPNNEVGKTLIIKEEAAEGISKPAANSDDTLRSSFGQ